jgi:hypothetical protein
MPKTPLRPSPPPLEANDVAIVGGGTVLWFVAFLALLPFHSTLAEQGRGDWQWICLAGGGLGLIGLWYCRARRDAIARDRDRAAAALATGVNSDGADGGINRDNGDGGTGTHGVNRVNGTHSAKGNGGNGDTPATRSD